MGADPHGGSATTAVTGLLAGSTLASMAAMFNDALNVWALPSLFTNLGQVPDGGAGFGASNASGGQFGDIRIGAVFIDGAIGPNVLAHAFNPCINILCGLGGSVGGDLHIDDGNSWVDDPNANVFALDLFTVVLHEFGHALGLGHSTVAGSVMEAVYAGARRTLHADDIAGIQAIYGDSGVIPLPAHLILLLSALGTLGVFGRQRAKTKQ